MKTYYGSLNTLNAPQVSFARDLSEMHPDTPTAINKNLQLSVLDKDLFPFLVTGVRCWPFLTLAFDCDTQQKENRIFSITKALRRELKKKGGQSIIGPSKKQSLRPYKSMCKKLNHKNYKPLREFLQNIEFNGKPSFFTAHEHDVKWKKVFKKTNGKQASAYIKARKDSRNGQSVPDVVTQLLSKEPAHYDKTLWYGSFCYAFLRRSLGRCFSNCFIDTMEEN